MKSLILTLIALAPLCLNAQNTNLSGEIKNPYQDWVYLQYFEEVNYKDDDGNERRRFDKIVVDSAKHENGKFAMEFQLDAFKELQFSDGNETATLYLNPGDKLELRLNTKFFDETLRFGGSGSDINNVMASYYLADEKMRSTVNQMSWSATEEDSASTIKNANQISDDFKLYIVEISTEFPNLKETMDANIKSVDKMMKRVPGNIKQWIEFAKMKKRVIGNDFLAVEGVDLEGKTVKLSDFYGKPIVLDFWATWCGPCMYEMPFMNPIEEAFHGEVTVISVAVWDKIDAWKEKTPELGFENNIFLEKEVTANLQKEYMLNYIPRYMLLDKEGKIVSVDAGRPSQDLKEQLETYLKDGTVGQN